MTYNEISIDRSEISRFRKRVMKFGGALLTTSFGANVLLAANETPTPALLIPMILGGFGIASAGTANLQDYRTFSKQFERLFDDSIPGYDLDDGLACEPSDPREPNDGPSGDLDWTDDVESYANSNTPQLVKSL